MLQGDGLVWQRCSRRGIIAVEPKRWWAGPWALQGEAPGGGASRGRVCQEMLSCRRIRDPSVDYSLHDSGRPSSPPTTQDGEEHRNFNIIADPKGGFERIWLSSVEDILARDDHELHPR
ncbi:uncharacterized protein LOC124650527 [Lolium rigidum]|uniref:uncharacterized protein LOC124650527 n=1 Tax=Lolium rigidum TaxID=89674 RepID=UPI001F5D1771|nr:uncharacterized protein LOC124650527 [Lolium rigidum]